MELDFFWKGLLIGLAIAAPIGPIAILCIRRTLEDGLRNGLATGLGAATADVVYGTVAALGIAAVSSRLVAWEDPIRLLGGVGLIFIGWGIFFAKLTETTIQSSVQGVLPAYASAVILTLTNPMTIIYYVAVFAGLRVADDKTTSEQAVILVTGVFIGSVGWWFFLAGAVAQFRRFLTNTRRLILNRVSGIILIGFGGYTIFSLV